MADIKKVSIGGTQYDIRDANAIEKGYAVNDFATNCITEIPQDIKLELNSGTLTLKAGSVITRPDGVQLQLTADRTVASPSGSAKYILFTNVTLSNVNACLLTNMCSGATDSLVGVGYHCWYDTTNNLIKKYGSDASNPDNYTSNALPFAIVTLTNGVWTSIDKVFKGAGYIGHHAFFLPRIKGFVPNELNSDGTLKSTSFKTNVLSIVEMNTNSPAAGYEKGFQINANGVSLRVNYREVDTIVERDTDTTNYRNVYVRETNATYWHTNNGWEKNSTMFLGSYTYNGTSVTKFDIRPVSGLSHNYIQNALTGVSGYASNKTQTLKHVNGVLTFVDG